MYRYKKLMVSLNLDEQDEVLIKYAGFISQMANAQQVRFIYVYDGYDIPEEVKKIYPQLEAPPGQRVETQMRKRVEAHFNGPESTELIFQAMEGSQLGLLVSSTKDYDIDLLIVGLNPDAPAAVSALPEKLARKAFCSVLVIPANTRVYFDNILTAVDFSDHSLNALDVGSAFAEAAKLDHIYILNAYQVPSGHHKTGKTYNEFAQIMLENAKSKLRQTLTKVDLKSVGIKPFFKNAPNVVKEIQAFSDTLGSPLIVVGARGRSGDIAAILLGSVTEGLIRTVRKPLLAVKMKGQGLNILEALTTE